MVSNSICYLSVALIRQRYANLSFSADYLLVLFMVCFIKSYFIHFYLQLYHFLPSVSGSGLCYSFHNFDYLAYELPKIFSPVSKHNELFVSLTAFC